MARYAGPARLGRWTLSVVGLVAATGLVGGSALAAPAAAPFARPAAAAEPAGDPGAAADWMVAQLDEDGLAPGFGPGYPDIGLSIDILWALIAVDPQDPRADALWSSIKAKAYTYTGTDAEDDYVSLGASAKVLLAAQTMGDGTTIPDGGGGSIDLRARLVAAIDPATGDLGAWPNAFDQSFAVMALARSGAGTTHPAVLQKAVDGLARRQCDPGYFVMYLSGESSCDAQLAAGQTAAPDTDGTAMGLMAYDAAGDAGASIPEGAESSGLDYLAGVQRPSGAFGGGVSTEGENTNSTGLVGAVLHEEGRATSAQRARDYVASVQADPGDGALGGETGAIAYDRDAFAEGVRDGIVGYSRGTWLRATPQAVLALAPALYGDLDQSDPATDPEPTPAPTITGTPVVGGRLVGHVVDTPGAQVSYRWLRDGRAINAYTTSYRPTSGDYEHRLTFRATVRWSDGRVEQLVSRPTARVGRGTFVAPTPTLSAGSTVGTTLTAYRGAWQPTPTTVSYRWLRDGTAIPYYGTTYRLRSADRGHAVSVRVTGSRTAYTTAVVSSQPRRVR